MADIMGPGFAWHASQLKAYASQPITYVRAYESVDLMVVLGKQLLKLDDGLGNIRMEWTDLSLDIVAADLFFSYGDLITPERGDIIYRVIGNQVQTYQVEPYGSEPAWRWDDSYQTMLKVHTKQIETEPYS